MRADAIVRQDKAESQGQQGGRELPGFASNSPQAAVQRRLQEMADNSPRAKQLKSTQAIAQGQVAQCQPVAQLQIKGGGKAGVIRLLEKQEAYARLIKDGGKPASKYSEALETMLETLNGWESAFEAADIAEALRINALTPSGVDSAKSALVSGIEEEIDEEVLTGGHSGEKHYGKDAKYQQTRMEKEGKAKVTTLEDSKRTKQFFAKVKKNVRASALSLCNPVLLDLETAMANNATVTVALIKNVTSAHLADDMDFDDYHLTFDTISVKGNTGGGAGVTVTFKPKLESNDNYPKTEYTEEGGEEDDAPIVMYWGGNSPQLSIATGESYDTLYSRLEGLIVSPVTAF